MGHVRSERWMRVLNHPITRTLFTVAAVAAIAVAFARAVDDASAVQLPAVSRLAAASTLLAVAMIMGGVAWSVLLPGRRFRQLAAGYFVAQLGKYIPGSLWQGVGQVMDATRLGAGRGAAVVAYLTQLATQAVAGGALAGLVLLAAPSGWMLAAALVAPVGIVLLYRPAIAVALRTAVRVAPSRLGHLPRTLPSQKAILGAFALGVATMAGVSAAYASLLPSHPGPAAAIAAAGAFALAWTAGFLVVPLPSGLGVREFVLVALLGDQHGTGTVLAAAVILRLLLIVVEAVLALLAQVLRVAEANAAADSRGPT